MESQIGFDASGGILRVSKGNKEMLWGKKTGGLYRLEGNVQTGGATVRHGSSGISEKSGQGKQPLYRGTQSKRMGTWRIRSGTRAQEDALGYVRKSGQTPVMQPVQDVHREAQRKETKSILRSCTAKGAATPKRVSFALDFDQWRCSLQLCAQGRRDGATTTRKVTTLRHTPVGGCGAPRWGCRAPRTTPSMSLFVPFANATKRMQPYFEEALQNLPSSITCIVSDGFLGWTLQSATKFGIPRWVFYGMSCYSQSVSRDVMLNGLLSRHETDEDEVFTVTSFPWIKLTKNDFDQPFRLRDPSGPHLDFIIDQVIAASKSYGLILNSFYELEAATGSHQKPTWLQWLDRKLAQGSSVLYVAFGSQAELSSQQLREIAIGLERSQVNFLWVVKKSESKLGDGFEERVKERGLVVREWVGQRAILGHQSVKGFLSHCGWNSVLESLCAKVPILAWPMMAEQHLNARMVVEEVRVGLRVETSDGSVRGFVKSEGLEKMVRELMEGEMGKEVREKVKEYGEAARRALEEGGSSWQTLNQLIDESYKHKEMAIRISALAVE
ncbi:UDP-Glycosyltransferase superfamily protein [Actinidia rufa]|uniref:Glycosyltransferase n=1 Tax=Actinidia rufa TaxID=165716 RepID=A0A7J0FBD6_9ERIC|nr:UDP-Glycosyltransferase superfamily protein [Actinidia rufa]